MSMSSPLSAYSPHHPALIPSPLSSSPPRGAHLSSPTPIAFRRRRPTPAQPRRSSGSTTTAVHGPISPQDASDPRKMLWKERFRARCAERVREERARGVQRLRRIGDSDEMEGDDDQNVEEEIFKRIVASTGQRFAHAQRAAYEREVGSDYDPLTFWDQPSSPTGPEPPEDLAMAEEAQEYDHDQAEMDDAVFEAMYEEWLRSGGVEQEGATVRPPSTGAGAGPVERGLGEVEMEM